MRDDDANRGRDIRHVEGLCGQLLARVAMHATSGQTVSFDTKPMEAHSAN